MTSRSLCVNGAFWPQRVTGQQRYAREMTAHLVPAASLVRPPEWCASPGRAWAWTQSGLVGRTRRSVLVSLTSRAPVAHPRQVFTVHDLFTLTNPEWFSPRYLRVKRPLLEWQLRHAAGLLTVSEPVRVQIRNLGLTPDSTPVAVAPNAAGAAFRVAADTALPFLAGRSSDRFFLAVGSLEPRKNLRRLVAAHTRLPAEVRREHPLVLVGSSSSIFAELGLSTADPEVVLTGFVTDEVLAAAYRRATAAVTPSLAEGFGLPLVEAHACGARLLVSDIPVFRWVAGDAATYFDPLDEADIARTLLEATSEVAPRRAALPRTYDYRDSAAVALRMARSLA